jgi:hypothetical protein
MTNMSNEGGESMVPCFGSGDGSLSSAIRIGIRAIHAPSSSKVGGGPGGDEIGFATTVLWGRNNDLADFATLDHDRTR